MTQSPRLFDQVKTIARLKHLSLKTEKSYLFYIRDFILFRKKRHPKEMGLDEIRTYLSHLAVERHVAASIKTVPLVHYFSCTAKGVLTKHCGAQRSPPSTNQSP
jgi:hypothetical protein